MDLDANDAQRLWRPEELAAIFRHQMSAPVQVDLGNLCNGLAGRVKMSAEAQGLLLKSFGDLLEHPNPPIELLMLVKEFAKASRNSPDSRIPYDVAAVLYFVCIAAAVVRCGRRISRLGDDELHEGFEWALAQTWLDDPTRAIFWEGLRSLPANHANERE